ncbi:MAG: hypothetical protein ACNYPD_05230 [Candidatus Halichondribacter symbioticus]
MLKLSKITLLLLGALGISSLSGCATLALLEKCAINPESDVRCGSSDKPLHVGPGHKQTDDVAVNSETLVNLIKEVEDFGDSEFASLFDSNTAGVSDMDAIGKDSAILAEFSEPTLPSGFVERLPYQAFGVTKDGLKGGFALYSIESANRAPLDPDIGYTQDGSGLENPLLFYAGILPGTTVGNALRSHYDQTFDEYGGIALSANEEIPALATWRGQVVVAVPEISPQSYWVKNHNDGGDYDYYRDVDYVIVTSDPFDLQVNYMAQQISAGTINVQAYGDDPLKYNATIYGDFGVSSGDKVGIGSTLAPGQLTGTFDLLGDRKPGSPITGIIGEEGAVGVFTGNYFGGFVAVPQ